MDIAHGSHTDTALNPERASLLRHIGFDRAVVRAEGLDLFDANGTRYLDALAQYGALPFGHNPAFLWERLARIRDAREPSFVQPLQSPGAEALARRLIALIASHRARMLPFLVLHHLHAWYGLTQANYVEHYGLLREKLADGRYEPPAPHHSWNSNHVFSNIILFHLQRHSDHHAHAARPYQALRDFPELPRLPSGYPGCFGLAAIPPLWFKVMDPKLHAWAGGDLRKLNVDPRARAALQARFS